MTAALQKAFTQAAKMPEDLQKQLAQQMLDDIEAEKNWDQTLARSQRNLQRLARKAKEARRRGGTHKKGFDEL